MSQKRVVIVGGVAGGASAAARLRRLDESAEIAIIEQGPFISFANCGLPYHIGGVIPDEADLTLQTPESFRARFAVDVRILQKVVSIDRMEKCVSVHNLQTDEIYSICYDELILSMGASPALPPISGCTAEGVFTLRSIPDTRRILGYLETHQVRSAVVVGGGFIGLEVCENLANRGISITLAELSGQVMPPLDPEMACQVHSHLRRKGVDLRLNTGIQAIQKENGTLNVTLGSETLKTDLVVLAAGVRPDTALAKEAGLRLNDRGAICVDTRMLTSDPSIYAVGDAVEIQNFVTGQADYIPLAGPANKQGRIAADQICGIDSRYTGTQGSSIAKVFELNVASTGISEKVAKRLGIAYDTVYTFPANHATYYPGATAMSLKLLFTRPEGKLLGAQLIGGEGVDKRCDVLATAIRAGMTVFDLTELELCYAPPFGSAKDPVNMAGYVAENLLTGKVKQIRFDQIESLPRDGSVQLLDVRTEGEFARGTIPGFWNLPLDSIRDSLNKLDKDKPVYVTCQVGLRGYLAARILMQHGFDVCNLSGGYRLWNSVFGQI